MDGVIRVLRAMRALDVDEIGALLVARRVPARASWGLVDVAEWLVEPQHVRDALERSGWRTLDRLSRGEPDALGFAARAALAVRVAAPAAPAASTASTPEAAAAGSRIELLEVARDELARLLERATPVGRSSAGSAPETGPDEQHALDVRGAERAHAVAALVADLVADLDATPRAARDGRGGPRLAGVEVRRVAAQFELPPEFVESVSDTMHRAGLVGQAGEAWAPAPRGRDLERGERIERWRALLAAWLDVLTIDDREAVLGEAPSPEPARGIDPAAFATQLGLLVDGRLTTAGRAALAGDIDAATAAIEPLLPAEVDGVYVQPDLSVISPGPLSAAAETRLRTVADLERRGTASTYRLSAASIDRALAAGLDAAEVEALLHELSLTPIPQPVSYLVAEADARHGLIRVRPGEGTGSVVSSVDAEAIDQLAVDHRLSALRLRLRTDGDLASTLSPSHVAAALADARFPATLVDASGEILDAPTPRTASAGAPPVPAATARFAAALRDDADRQGDADDANAWLVQRLERARRGRTPVALRVRVPDAPVADLRAIPVSLSPRWLRVIDPDADVERTFPLAAVELADEIGDEIGDDGGAGDP